MPAISLLIKPASGNCNLRCSYCFYADEMKNRQQGNYGMMTIETMQAMIRNVMDYAEGDVTFAFQGGEPTVRGLDFYRQFSACVKKCQQAKPSVRVHYALQTNGTLLNEDWAAYLSRENYLVGVSIDGPRSLHDLYRKDTEDKGTFKTILRNLHYLDQYRVEYNILTVLTQENAKQIDRIYRFLMSRGYYWQQYIPCLNPLDPVQAGEGALDTQQPETPDTQQPGTLCTPQPETPYALQPETYGQALCTLFDLWYEDYCSGGESHIRYFENLIGMYAGIEPESCDMRGCCSVQYVVEADGSVYPCDFYVLDTYRIGNITTDNPGDMARSAEARAFRDASLTAPDACRSCEWYQYCRGGCRRNRFYSTVSAGGAEGRRLEQRFCPAFRMFFSYADARLKKLAANVRR